MTVACFGDSLIYGFPYGEMYSWVYVVEKTTGIRMINYGICGETCVEIGQRLRFGKLPAGVSHLLFFGGANDVLQMTPAEVSLGEVRRVIDYAEEINLPICIVLPLLSGEESVNTKLAGLREKMTKLAEGRAYVLDLQPAVGMNAEERDTAYSDGFHPKAAVYEKMGNFAAPLIDNWCKL